MHLGMSAKHARGKRTASLPQYGTITNDGWTSERRYASTSQTYQPRNLSEGSEESKHRNPAAPCRTDTHEADASRGLLGDSGLGRRAASRMLRPRRSTEDSAGYATFTYRRHRDNGHCSRRSLRVMMRQELTDKTGPMRQTRRRPPRPVHLAPLHRLFRRALSRLRLGRMVMSAAMMMTATVSCHLLR